MREHDFSRSEIFGHAHSSPICIYIRQTFLHLFKRNFLLCHLHFSTILAAISCFDRAYTPCSINSQSLILLSDSEGLQVNLHTDWRFQQI